MVWFGRDFDFGPLPGPQDSTADNYQECGAQFHARIVAFGGRISAGGIGRSLPKVGFQASVLGYRISALCLGRKERIGLCHEHYKNIERIIVASSSRLNLCRIWANC